MKLPETELAKLFEREKADALALAAGRRFGRPLYVLTSTPTLHRVMTDEEVSALALESIAEFITHWIAEHVNLAERLCRECGGCYDTPHAKHCQLRPFQMGANDTAHLVKMSDL